jgi:hypothetical protein
MYRLITIWVILFCQATYAVDIWQDRLSPTFRNAFSTKGFAIVASGALMTGLTQPIDYKVRDNMVHYQRIPEEKAEIGDFLGTGIPGASIAALQLYFDTDNGYAHAEALLETMFTSAFLKAANKRQRPNSANQFSMPSAHTSTVFATATSLAYAYGYWVGIPAFALASFVAATRLADNAHWLSDTVAGATVGIFWGRAAAHPDAQANSVKLIPTPFYDGMRLYCVWHF